METKTTQMTANQNPFLNQKNTFTAYFSSKLFGGFQTEIDISLVSSLEDIIVFATSVLFDVLERNNFQDLLRIARQTNFHVHNVTFEEAISNGLWICDHEAN